ncbi:uncharacterized protein LOC100840728 [Brachypodium distachyon]|uniref:Uncharacterized protein n=1 Tax=Brachypodium distachyon TaxID=15368 RepID=A0A0Q3IA19_BRADI|nr:uncharacterized protein LOC100840728 [Brachypodium distachyon]KQK02675.1 hypothetical protein BRADI_2g03006v3 [Brachypodium distachyon]|eukprot:XP_003568555.1 uncharacterized protein LOC100840728 [Brachypodium distachyon]
MASAAAAVSSAVEKLQAAAKDAANSSSSSSSCSAFSDQVIVSRASGRVVSLSTCTKVGAISFVVGIAVGFTLKRRLRQWAARLLKRIKDDN